MATQTEIEQNIRKIAKFLGAIQGLTWIILSIINIALYLNHSTIPEVNSYMDEVGSLMYLTFLAREIEPRPNQILKRGVFCGFMWVYLICNIIWLFSSFKLRTKNDQRLVASTKLWSQITFLICFVDFIFVIILGADYGHCMQIESMDPLYVGELCANGVLSTLVIAAKGFILWFVNLIFACVLYKMSHILKVNPNYVKHTNAGQQYVNQPPHGPSNYAPNVPGWHSNPAPYSPGMPSGNSATRPGPYQTGTSNLNSGPASHPAYQPQTSPYRY